MMNFNYQFELEKEDTEAGRYNPKGLIYQRFACVKNVCRQKYWEESMQICKCSTRTVIYKA